jgi:hypothetical protein
MACLCSVADPRFGSTFFVPGRRCVHVVSQVTEHTQFVDVYDLTESGLSYVHSSSLIPAGESQFWNTMRGADVWY